MEVLYGGTHPMPNLRRKFIRSIAAGFVTPNLLKQTDRFAEVFNTLFDCDAWLLGKGEASDEKSTPKEADSIVPDFIKKYDRLKEHHDLTSVASLGSEALNLLHRFANTKYGPDLVEVEKKLREDMF